MIKKMVAVSVMCLITTICKASAKEVKAHTPPPNRTVSFLSSAVSIATYPFSSDRKVVAEAIANGSFTTKYPEHTGGQNALNLALTQVTAKAIDPNEHNRMQEMLQIVDFAAKNNFAFTPKLRTDALAAIAEHEKTIAALKTLLAPK